MTEDEFKKTVTKLNRIVRGVSRDSALDGLATVAAAFAELLNTYALPNANNSLGMCDDPKAFRKIFASIIAKD